LLFNWAAQIEKVSPGSLIEIELEKVGKKNMFKRIFIALKPCVDGFLARCRPFLGIDASSLKEDKGLQKGITTTSVLPFCSNLSLAKTNKVTIVFAKQEEANIR